MTRPESASGGNFLTRLGAVAFSASWFKFFRRMSMRFIPAPSPKSIGAILPASSDARNELTSAMLAVFS